MAALFEYELLGTVREGARVQVYDAARSGAPDRRWVVSEVALDAQSQTLLRQSLECLRAGRCPALEAVYTRRGRFYLVCAAPEGMSLRAALEKGLDKTPATQRFALLRSILLALYEARGLPYPLVLAAAGPEQVRVGRDGTPGLCFALTDAALAVPPKEAERALCRGGAGLLRQMFPRELENRENRALRLIAGKCEAGLYPSLPALACDLAKVQEDCAPPDWDRWADRAWKGLVGRLGRLKGLAVPAALAAALCAGAVVLSRGEVPPETGEPFLIGHTVYAADPMAPSAASLAPEEPPVPAEPEPGPKAVTEDPEGYTDHVVRSGEVLEEVCDGFYGDGAYAPAVAAYNGLDPETPLAAGTILKLPEPAAEQGESK